MPEPEVQLSVCHSPGPLLGSGPTPHGNVDRAIGVRDRVAVGGRALAIAATAHTPDPDEAEGGVVLQEFQTSFELGAARVGGFAVAAFAVASIGAGHGRFSSTQGRRSGARRSEVRHSGGCRALRY